MDGYIFSQSTVVLNIMYTVSWATNEFIIDNDYTVHIIMFNGVGMFNAIFPKQ